MQNFGRVYEEIKVRAQDLVEKVKMLLHEGNVRRVIIKDDHGNTFMEIPLSIATLGVIAVPVLAAVGAIAGALSHFTIVVERVDRTVPAAAPPATPWFRDRRNRGAGRHEGHGRAADRLPRHQSRGPGRRRRTRRQGRVVI